MKLLIIGGVAAGMSCAARARRLSEEAEITVLEKGPFVSFANCGLPYYLGREIQDRENLLIETPESIKDKFNIDVRINSEALKIDRNQKTVLVKNLKTDESYSLTYDKLVLAPGSAPLRPPLPGIDLPGIFTLRGINDMDEIEAAITKGAKTALIIGGGYIGVELAENFIRRKLDVHLVQIHEHLMSTFDPEMARVLQEEAEANGVKLHMGTAAASFEKTETGIRANLSNSEKIDADFVIMSVGVKPESALAHESGLDIGRKGGIKVNNFLETSDDDIFAAGDAVEVRDEIAKEHAQIPLAGPANRQGRIIADNIFGRKSEYKSTLGTAIVKVFNVCAACTGATEKTLIRRGREYKKIYLHPNSHASYYPGAAQMHIKLLFNPDDAKIFGAQITGSDGVDKRIDVIAAAIRAGMTLFDMEQLELAYAPPYGSAKDPVNMAAFIACNLLEKKADFWYPEDYPSKTADGIIIDVRPSENFNLGHIPGAINIPMDELRNRINEIPADKDIYLNCRVGFNSYLAYRVLIQNGFGANHKLKTLSGGFLTFKLFHHELFKKASAGNKIQKGSDMPAETNSSKDSINNARTSVILDACGLQCPGPIMKLKKAIGDMTDGSLLTVLASDPGFTGDAQAWCETNGHTLLAMKGAAPKIEVTIMKGKSSPAPAASQQNSGNPLNRKTIVVFSGDLDKVLAAFVIANGALAMGSEVSMFFTFWGLNALRKNAAQSSNKGLIDKMFGMMMPKGPSKLKLSKMNMMGMGTAMMKMVMKNKKVEDLPSLIESARHGGVKIIACSMSMDVMGLKKEELIDGIEIGGVAAFLGDADKSSATLFI